MQKVRHCALPYAVGEGFKADAADDVPCFLFYLMIRLSLIKFALHKSECFDLP